MRSSHAKKQIRVVLGEEGIDEWIHTASQNLKRLNISFMFAEQGFRLDPSLTHAN
jgi:hypothetical protein